MKIYLIICYLFLLALMMIGLSFHFLFSKSSVLVYWDFFDVLGVELSMNFYFDWVSLMFSGVVLLITFFVLSYSVEYLGDSKFMDLYFYLVLLFVGSMGLVIFSPNMLSILLGWDGLGLISYCLVSYYQNFFSYKSSMLTLLMNRIGDLTLVMGICLSWGGLGWSYLVFQEGGEGTILLSILILISGGTKSAQVPLSIWLPAAMAAPTPISSLVHSSTLVTAGVYLFLRFSVIHVLISNNILMLISMFTVSMSSFVALFIYDLKKIIAMSTLSQLGLMMFFYSWGVWDIVFFHLLTHALFKSMMFMCAGVIIHYMGDIQDLRFMGGLGGFNLPYTISSFLVSSFALAGVPFLAGFYSKDFMVEMSMMMHTNFMLFILNLLLLGVTMMYSMRILFYISFSSGKTSMMNSGGESLLMSGSLTVLSGSSVVSGIILVDLLFYAETIYLPVEFYLIPLFCVLVGGLLITFLYKSKMKLISVFHFISLMWGMNLMLGGVNMYTYMLMQNILIYFDKGWMEEVLLIFLKKLMEQVTYLLNIYYNYIYFMVVIWSMVMLVYLISLFISVLYWSYKGKILLSNVMG